MQGPINITLFSISVFHLLFPKSFTLKFFKVLDLPKKWSRIWNLSVHQPFTRVPLLQAVRSVRCARSYLLPIPIPAHCSHYRKASSLTRFAVSSFTPAMRQSTLFRSLLHDYLRVNAASSNSQVVIGSGCNTADLSVRILALEAQSILKA